MDNKEEQKVVIIGGGFGGVSTALDLSKLNIANLKITLVSDKPHFEYHPALYRVVTGKSPLEVCIPLEEIFAGKKVEVVEDKISKIQLEDKVVIGQSGSKYKFNFLVLALGSETAYLAIPGLMEHSFGFKSISEAIRLKNHLHAVFAKCKTASKEEKVCLVHIIIVGAGTSGTELAGELALYTKTLAKNHDIDPTLVTIDLIEAAPQILPSLPSDIAKNIEKRLRFLGINIFVNRTLLKEEIREVYLKDMKMKTKTVIWTAGVAPNALLGRTRKFRTNQKGQVIVDEYLQAAGHTGVFVIGDGAAGKYSGMAQTAIADGKIAAANIGRLINGLPLIKNQPQKPIAAIPVGKSWAAVIIGKVRIYGTLGWVLRRLADLRFFASVLPLKKALLAFGSGKTLCESCPICLPESSMEQ
ncbi:hypothetical protein A2697_02570 [Candidatus Curtissbacteria bacterium RIFCSPHIGHO2_01_FULL_41_44]|uniref:FAD/NAD(P)-binding domain-containing protein n=1 Tax=Candidatus Curtissbacteria bacterium RIFCSPLOWO2_01_FULL_42_50 TaxID=1797730 RepID=A0A1F5H294_9BACT|nr:MAG: hypothetical protein A2697_02570 [Candidatus Curtissbacteria bacterium RIFCSPHIGHO2_01_FULL_41_44]OGD92862.1 MAG: hypothetical protein A3C33_02085 [Candidatus Curtissbacteria bacterium RIFCSPHIGHO2_02_FULL_42_58]OGD96579.1 MAG: hypothetical protein A3E71_02735 [Candidatus Curtissbacteria bacterium RIFCSPHIGHO2_12_FULL_42_33]OGD98280.1 MAG: hypothetical protein A3B54_04175 [Candidatus Curtissbacteria bacterium RIFCSPLOWO2_01_FULL_42_50]OGE03457.1 MAG: hypothetical protein A3G16_02540 [Ca